MLLSYRHSHHTSRWLEAQMPSLDVSEAERASLHSPRAESGEHRRCCHGERSLSGDHCEIGAGSGCCREIEVLVNDSDASRVKLDHVWPERQNHSMPDSCRQNLHPSLFKPANDCSTLTYRGQNHSTQARIPRYLLNMSDDDKSGEERVTMPWKWVTGTFASIPHPLYFNEEANQLQLVRHVLLNYPL